MSMGMALAQQGAIDPSAIVAEVEALGVRIGKVRAAVGRVIFGQDEVVDQTLITLLSGGHALLVGVPGLGKSRLVETLGVVLGLATKRVQFTPDLMPADIIGSEVLDIIEGRQMSRFIPGPVFCQLLMADEINRASPRTQSALLQSMQEHRVSVRGTEHRLPVPFHVLATQNPIEQEGTYPLPEAQRDRFSASISLGYPPRGAERDMLDTHGSSSPLEALKPVARASDVQDLVVAVRNVLVSDQVKDYIISLANATRTSPELRLGASPRATLQLLRASRAWAALDGRDYVIPDDVQRLARPVLAQRLLPTADAIVERHQPEEVVDRIVAQLPLPRR